MDWGVASPRAPLNWESVNLSRFLGAALRESAHFGSLLLITFSD